MRKLTSTRCALSRGCSITRSITSIHPLTLSAVILKIFDSAPIPLSVKRAPPRVDPPRPRYKCPLRATEPRDPPRLLLNLRPAPSSCCRKLNSLEFVGLNLFFIGCPFPPSSIKAAREGRSGEMTRVDGRGGRCRIDATNISAESVTATVYTCW